MPIVFVERTLRSGTRFRNLQDHYFTASEKEWLCGTITKPYLSSGQVDRNVSLYCDRYSISNTCVHEWLILKSLGEKQLVPGYCTKHDDDCLVDAIGLEAMVNYDLGGRGELETTEAHILRWRAFLRHQENATITRRAASFNMQSKRLKIKQNYN